MWYIEQITVGKFKANYYLEDTGKAKVLFIHGITSSINSFSPLFNIKRDYDMVAVELPYHGNTYPLDESKLNDSYDIIKGAKFVVDFIDALKVKIDLVVGHSMGALAALKVLDSNRANKGLLLSPLHYVKVSQEEEKTYRRWILAPTLKDAEDAAISLRYKSRLITRFFISKFKVINNTYAIFLARHFAKTVDKLFTYEDADYLKQLYKNNSEKFEMMSGKEDPLTTTRALSKVATDNSIKFTILPKSSHDIVFDKTSKVNLKIEELLKIN
ncbi:pimeloyl-ACP methyl ester carboxylesterase [Mycoplasma testudineum]|uniref:Pimeloyl-ACP methyl ester carboxylesterase n=1 Tax=Mycoplasma testudineum TaxID=244584 RepID=A0A4R6IDR7_9MOLU|nr:alpha/beta hydrolase [Mycoplasma testudineum]OYD26715.1 hypothetical protein CG473_02855 [Mycoplasma testudineum]TDO19846.1 pimeloyl-ACP methyl ester carboxylesterase [Mycoplasma testudineum]